MHYRNGCDVDCRSYAQGKLTHITVDAYDRDSVLGDKPRIHVSLNRTLRVKKALAKIKKERAALGMVPASVAEVHEGNPMLEADGDRLNMVPEQTSPWSIFLEMNGIGPKISWCIAPGNTKK